MNRGNGGRAGRRLDILFVDLNNFASFPTLAVGLLVASLREAGHGVSVLVPLAHDVPAIAREKPDRLIHHMMRRVHLSDAPGTRRLRDMARHWYYRREREPHPIVLREVGRALDARPDVLMLSAYLQHHATVVALCALARKAGVPVLLGGPAFNLAATAEAWRGIDGVGAIFGGEAEAAIGPLAETLVDKGDLLAYPGITLPDGRSSGAAAPLRQLENLPIPDFTDFPWSRYPVAIVPVMTGRGCQWARCTFCSDVLSASGRTFRSRTADAVLTEMQAQAERHATRNFLFLDLKLNSNPPLLRELVTRIPQDLPGALWIGTVHVDTRKDNGLSPRELEAAVAAGMRRVSFGLESGSQRLFDRMDKGSTVAGNAAFIRAASSAGLSIRCTMFKGYPGETAADLEQTAAFLETHGDRIDRIRFNDFSLPDQTPIWHAVRAQETSSLHFDAHDARNARAVYSRVRPEDRAYRRAKQRVLRAVYEINRRPLRSEARMFDGLM